MSLTGEDTRENDDVAVGLDRSIERLENRRDSKEERRLAGDLRGQRMRGWTEKLLTRTMSGVIYVVVIVGCLVGGRISTAVLFALMGWLCCSEFFRITRMAGRMPNELLGLGAALLFPAVAPFGGFKALLGIACALVVAVATWYVFTPRVNIADVAVSVFGPLYTSLPLSSVVLVRSAERGLAGALLALVVIGSIWAEDSCAYLVGSSIGRHKMAPRISPKKSWEGFYGGIVGSLCVWAVAAWLGLGGIGWPLAMACGLAESVVAVIGDLFESRIKRAVGVKDSGNILPGHGGLLDRTDSMLFGSLVAYCLLMLGGIV